MSFKINHGKPAVTETRIVVQQEAVPTTVTVTKSMHEALIVAAVQGASTGGTPTTVYSGLRDHPLFRAYYNAVREAIEYGKDGKGIQRYQANCLSIGALQERFDDLKQQSQEL